MPVRRPVVLLTSALTLSLALSACTQSRSTSREPRSDTTRAQGAARFGGGYPGRTSDLEGLARRLGQGNERLKTLGDAKRLWGDVRFPTDTLGGKPGFIGLHRAKRSRELTVLYDNGLVLNERWSPRSTDPVVLEQQRAGQRRRSVEPTSAAYYYGSGNATVYRLRVDGVAATGSQRGVFYGSAHGDIEQPAHVSWRKGDVEFHVSALDIPLEDLIKVADSMR